MSIRITQGFIYPQYDVSPDDHRFVMSQIEEAASHAELILVQNFCEELKRLVPN